MMEVWITPARRRSTTRRRKKTPVLRVRHLVSRKLKTIHPCTMHRLLIIAPALATHPKPSLRDAHHFRLDDRTLRTAQLCPTRPRRRCHTFFLISPTCGSRRGRHFHCFQAGCRQAASSISCCFQRPGRRIGFQSSLSFLRNCRNLQTPSSFPQSFEAALAEIVFVGFPVFVAEVCQLHRLQHSIHNHRRPQARAKSQKQHAAPFIAAERLHGGVIEYLHGTAKSLAEVESHPAGPRVMGLVTWVSVNDWTGISQ